MAKPIIKISFQNGLSFQSFKKDVFDINGVSDLFDFKESAKPDFIVFGPYGNDIPSIGNYIRIGYFCENVKPDLSICEWAFGMSSEEKVNSSRYKKIHWHATNPLSLIKTANYDAEKVADQKIHFCNFLYSHRVSYREQFFKQLSKYKKVDAPGRSMKNMPGIDKQYTGDIWERKRQFLLSYKFTLAFENHSYPGYQTEKLYDAMLTNSIPIYFGDPNIGEIFNTASFVNAADFAYTKNKLLISWLENITQPDFIDIRPASHTTPLHRLKRKFKAWGRNAKMHLQFKNTNFKQLIDRIIQLDTDRYQYIKMLRQPWLANNTTHISSLSKNRWIEIFEQKHE